MWSGIGNAIGELLMWGAISFICAVLLLGYFVYDVFIKKDTTKIESRVLITPTIKLTTDGKTIDTIYIYQVKK